MQTTFGHFIIAHHTLNWFWNSPPKDTYALLRNGEHAQKTHQINADSKNTHAAPVAKPQLSSPKAAGKTPRLHRNAGNASVHHWLHETTSTEIAGSHPEIVGPPEISRPEIAQIHHQLDGITQKQNFRETPKGTAKKPKRGGGRELHRNRWLAATQERPTKHQGPNRQKKKYTEPPGM